MMCKKYMKYRGFTKFVLSHVEAWWEFKRKPIALKIFLDM